MMVARLSSLRTQGRQVARVLSVERLQPRLDRGPPPLQERRKRELLAEAVHRLVRRETRAVGGDFEQDAVGFAEIQAAEIEAVDLAGVADAQFVEPLCPAVVLRLVRRTERDVMHG